MGVYLQEKENEDNGKKKSITPFATMIEGQTPLVE